MSRLEKAWPALAFTNPDPLPLPSRPGVSWTKPYIAHCHFCSQPHMTKAQFIACRVEHKGT